MYCQYCGSQLPDGAQACGSCGQPVSGVPNVAPVNETASANVSVQQAPAKEKRPASLPGFLFGLVFGIGIFLPYVAISFFGASAEKALIDGSDGVIFLILAILAIFAAITNSKVSMCVIGALAVLIAIFEGIGTFHDAEYGTLYSRQIGYYCTLVGSFGILGSGIYEIVKQKK